MAEIVSIIGITHNPFMPRLFKQPQQPPGAAKVQERIAMMRQKLAEAEPDVLVCIGNDHLHQFFMDNMPAFMIGKMTEYDGTFYDEEREFGLPKCKLPGDVDVADLGRGAGLIDTTRDPIGGTGDEDNGMDATDGMVQGEVGAQAERDLTELLGEHIHNRRDPADTRLQQGLTELIEEDDDEEDEARGKQRR